MDLSELVVKIATVLIGETYALCLRKKHQIERNTPKLTHLEQPPKS
jgi:hypothetical protein